MQTLPQTRPGPTAEPSSLPALIETLCAVRSPSGYVLSAFVDTSPDRVEKRAFLTAFRDAGAELRPMLAPTEAAAFDAAFEQARTYLTDELEPRHPGLAVYASGDAAYLYVASLPTRPVERIAWADRPDVEPLQEAVDDFERVALALFDKERTRLFTFFLGALEWREEFEDDVPGKQATGGWFGLAQARYARHHEEHVSRHARRTARALLRLLRSRPFDRLLLAGPPEAIVALRRVLPRPLEARLAGTLALEWFASDDEVTRAALAEAERIERASELDAVQELIDAGTGEHAVLGAAGTLNALAKRRVHVLVVADSFDAAGAECPACGQLVTGGSLCPYCGAPSRPVADLRRRAVRQALDQDASVQIVSNAAAERLSEAGGLGAWTRY